MMQPAKRRRVILILAAALIAAAVAYAYRSGPVAVQTATVERARLEVRIEEEGRTAVVEDYVVSAPAAAFMRRIDLDVGDYVQAGQPVIFLEPPRPADLDDRTRREAAAGVERAGAGLAQAEEQLRAAQAEAARAIDDRDRLARLQAGGAATRQELEQARTAALQAEANLDAAQAAVEVARAELERTRAAIRPAPAGGDVEQVLRAPVSGYVLAVHRRSAGHVGAGEALIDIGDVDRLEIHTDVLSQDAVRIGVGTRVLVEQWGGAQALEAVVTRIEPQAFTEVSALGVEEQRVWVVAGFVSPRETWARLGSGYRVLAQFVVWERDHVLQVPTGALFRVENGWAVFRIESGKAVRRAVTIGEQAGLAAQVVSGLDAGDVVIVHPGERVEDGARVEPLRP